jgi:hypothetical protein
MRNPLLSWVWPCLPSHLHCFYIIRSLTRNSLFTIFHVHDLDLDARPAAHSNHSTFPLSSSLARVRCLSVARLPVQANVTVVDQGHSRMYISITSQLATTRSPKLFFTSICHDAAIQFPLKPLLFIARAPLHSRRRRQALFCRVHLVHQSQHRTLRLFQLCCLERRRGVHACPPPSVPSRT